MAENKEDVISRINDINREIIYHENEKAKHLRALEKLRIEKSILMMKGEWVMAENKMEAVAQLFGKKLNEEFTVRYEDKVKTWKFDERGLLYHNVKENEWRKNYGYLDFLIRGKAVIIDE